MKLGTVVRKKAGGFLGIAPRPTGHYMLTVRNINAGMVECCWTEEEGIVKYRQFHEDTLHVYKMDE